MLHRWSGAQAAIGLLVEQPLETWAVIERWHDEALLVPIWRQLTAASAAMLLGAVGWAIGATLPDRIDATALPLPARLEPAVAFWRDAVAQATVPHVAIHTAAVLSLLRWDPVGTGNAVRGGANGGACERLGASAGRRNFSVGGGR